ncbi:MAG: oxalate/formate MFS antiporter [Acidobacteriota bacterium]|nr:oxalate/formate MFS antiporter [Acidobacteriota bacterium]
MNDSPISQEDLGRRWRLAAAVTAMIMIGNLQYAWTLFVPKIIGATGWKLSQVQLGFTVFIAVMTWTMPLSGWLIDRLGPRVFMSLAAVLVAVGWSLLGYMHTLMGFYVVYAIAGIGNSFVYCCSIAVALKWFPDKRGLASGLIAGGYGSGAALFIPLFAFMIKAIGHQRTFLYTGIGLGILILAAGQFLTHPPPGFRITARTPVKPRVRKHHGEELNSWQMLRRPQFYVLYAMMLLAGVGGLMASAQVKLVADNFRIGATSIAIALSLNPICNGLGRVTWGWVSDHLGRERTMFIAFFLQSVFLLGVVTVGRRGNAWFIAMMALVFLSWGAVYSLFPAVSGDMFGTRNAASNYSLLYSTKGVGSILAGWLAALLFERSGSWNYVFYGSALLAFLAAMGAIVLRNMPSPRKPAEENSGFRHTGPIAPVRQQ